MYITDKNLTSEQIITWQKWEGENKRSGEVLRKAQELLDSLK